MNDQHITEYLESIRNMIRSGYREGVFLDGGIIYLGPLYRGEPYGNGTIILPSGKHFTYKFPLPGGQKIITYPDGKFYIGETLPNRPIPHGTGIRRYANGDIERDGDWYMGYDPARVAWICTPLWYDEKGNLHEGALFGGTLPPPFWSYHLCPVVYLTDHPIRSTDDGVSVAEVMFPHREWLGLSNNRFICIVYRTPELAVKRAGFSDLEDYILSVIAPEIKFLERLKTTVELVGWVYTIFNILQGGNKVLEEILESHLKQAAKHVITESVTELGTKFLIEEPIVKVLENEIKKLKAVAKPIVAALENEIKKTKAS